MAFSIITLYPFGQGAGELHDADVNDDPVLVDGGSVSDDSDSSYVEQGTWQSTTGLQHAEALATYFKTPDGFDPQFMLIQARMRNNAYLYANPPDGTRSFYTELKSMDASTLYDYEINSGSDILDSIININPDPGVPDFTWFTWWAQDNTVDLDNPATENGWYRLDWDYDRDPGDKAALIGDGLRLDMGMSYAATATSDTRYPWVDYAEVRLLVAGASAGKFPLRRYPREDGLGNGPTRHYPPPKSRRIAGGYH
jgi:hypothetical protein